MSKERANLTGGTKRIIMGILERYSTFGRTTWRTKDSNGNVTYDNGPYRTPANPPKEKVPMSENYRIIKLIATFAIIGVSILCGTCTFKEMYVTQNMLEKAKLDTERSRHDAAKEMFSHQSVAK